jgi:tetratricopeptide (TPR) repeat protein
LRRYWSLDLTQVIALFEQARTYAPQEPLILSGYAVALARQAYFHVEVDPTLLQKARLFATQAHQMAPERAEALFALAMASFVAEHHGDALVYLEKALRIDPNYADALDLLGRIEGEFLDLNAARQHLQMACFLDPSIDGARFDLMRICALLNRWQEVDALILQAAPEEPHTRAIYQISRARLNLWRPDPQPLTLEQLQGASPLVLQGIKILDHVRQTRTFTDEQLALYFRERIEPQVGKRFRCLLLQQLAEALSYCGRFDRVIEIIQLAFNNGLRDLNWLRFFPLFAPLRSTQPFQSLLHQVTQRVQSYLAPTNEAPLLHR